MTKLAATPKRRIKDSCTICLIEATKTTCESEPNFDRFSRASPRAEVKNRGRLRVHARPTTRTLRKGAIGRNVESRPNSCGHIVLARGYAPMGSDLRFVRAHRDGASFEYRRR